MSKLKLLKKGFDGQQKYLCRCLNCCSLYEGEFQHIDRNDCPECGTVRSLSFEKVINVEEGNNPSVLLAQFEKLVQEMKNIDLDNENLKKVNKTLQLSIADIKDNT